MDEEKRKQLKVKYIGLFVKQLVINFHKNEANKGTALGINFRAINQQFEADFGP